MQFSLKYVFITYIDAPITCLHCKHLQILCHIYICICVIHVYIKCQRGLSWNYSRDFITEIDELWELPSHSLIYLTASITASARTIHPCPNSPLQLPWHSWISLMIWNTFMQGLRLGFKEKTDIDLWGWEWE